MGRGEVRRDEGDSVRRFARVCHEQVLTVGHVRREGVLRGRKATHNRLKIGRGGDRDVECVDVVRGRPVKKDER
jgi:hypothetical protein